MCCVYIYVCASFSFPTIFNKFSSLGWQPPWPQNDKAELSIQS